jgi:hypothetical protein
VTEAVHFAGADFPLDAESVASANEPVASLERLRGFTHLRELRLVHTDPHSLPAHSFDDLEPLTARRVDQPPPARRRTHAGERCRPAERAHRLA